MNDTNDDIVTRAEAYLSKITSGEWKWVDHGKPFGNVLSIGDPDTDCVLRARIEDYDSVYVDVFTSDAEFIAASPALVRELVDEVKRLRDFFSAMPFFVDEEE